MPRARKSGSARATGASGTARSEAPDAKTKLIDAAFKLARERGWRAIGMGEIATAADIPLATAYALFPTKAALLAGFTRQVNEKVLAAGTAEGTGREKLFELLMRRFDALKPYRPAFRALMRDSIGDPAALCGVPIFLNSMGWMLEAAGISAAGWFGPMRVLALAGAYAGAFRVFLSDDSDDLSKTMAALDRRLKAGPFGAGESQRQASAA